MQVQNGWVTAARPCPSPNFNQRPPDVRVDMLVIHCISLPPGNYGGDYIERFFCNRLEPSAHPYFEEICELQVAAHFLIRRDGELVQFVSCDERAWHAGDSRFCGRENCNDFSIGIELEGSDSETYEQAQYETLAPLSATLMRTYPAITHDRIVGHEDIAPGRKTDPGGGFDWRLFKEQLASIAQGGV